jgi:hypothetical protein
MRIVGPRGYVIRDIGTDRDSSRVARWRWKTPRRRRTALAFFQFWRIETLPAPANRLRFW